MLLPNPAVTAVYSARCDDVDANIVGLQGWFVQIVWGVWAGPPAA